MLSELILIYDGQCKFCGRVLAVFRALDVFRTFRIRDSRERHILLASYPAIRDRDFSEAMYAVSAEGDVYRGFYAFRRMIWNSPVTWVLIPVFYFPGIAVLGERVYAAVSQNRERLGCRTDACSVPSQESQTNGSRRCIDASV